MERAEAREMKSTTFIPAVAIYSTAHNYWPRQVTWPSVRQGGGVGVVNLHRSMAKIKKIK